MSKMNRRHWLAGTGLLAGGALVSAARAIEPIQRTGRTPWKLGLAGYSMRKYFQAPADAADKLDLAGFLAFCAQHGVDGAELTQYYFPSQVTQALLCGLKRQAHLLGIEICGGAIRNNFTVEPGEELDGQLQHVRTWGEHYAVLGAPVMRVFAGQPGADVSEAMAIDRAAAAFQRAGDAAASYGVMLAIENHDFTTQVDRLLAILQQVQSPWIGVNFDSGNFGRSDDPYGDMARIAPYAINAQIKLSVGSRGGQQEADWPRILGILRDAGYAGYVTLEYEEADDPRAAIPRHLDRLRKLIA